MSDQRSLQSNPGVIREFYVQQYGGGKPKIEGVHIIPLKTWMTEDGDFAELVRLNDQGELEQAPGLKVRQINRSTLLPNTVKAWHFHFNQDEAWYVPPTGQLMLGLWDVRSDSATKDVTMRVVLGGASPSLVVVPRGVAHGACNLTNKPVELYYYVSQQFSPESPDENRIPWNAIGEDFWKPERD